jgi:uncharacterized OB-fold protein
MSRHLPVPTQLSRGFWDAAAEHRLVVPRCEKCGERFFPAERLCPACGSALWEYVESAGCGTVTACTVVYRAPSPDFDVPYVVAVVELDDGCPLLTNLVLEDPESASIGMRVDVVFLDHADGRALPVFTSGVARVRDEPEKG